MKVTNHAVKRFLERRHGDPNYAGKDFSAAEARIEILRMWESSHIGTAHDVPNKIAKYGVRGLDAVYRICGSWKITATADKILTVYYASDEQRAEEEEATRRRERSRKAGMKRNRNNRRRKMRW